MNNQKIHLKTVLLLGFIIIFVVGIFYFSIQLREGVGSAKLPTKRIKIKAAVKNYTKLIALNNVSPSSNPSSYPSPSLSSLVLSPTSSLSPSLSPLLSPSPTDIIVAKNNISPTQDSSILSLTETVSPTIKQTISQLPKSGYIGYTLAIFGVGLTMILFAFVL